MATVAFGLRNRRVSFAVVSRRSLAARNASAAWLNAAAHLCAIVAQWPHKYANMENMQYSAIITANCAIGAWRGAAHAACYQLAGGVAHHAGSRCGIAYAGCLSNVVARETACVKLCNLSARAAAPAAADKW